MPIRKKAKKARKTKIPGPPAKALERFVADTGMTLTAAARALRCTHPALIGWFSGTVPKARFRKNIAVWTGGKIAESDWEKTDDVAPFRKGTAA